MFNNRSYVKRFNSSLNEMRMFAISSKEAGELSLLCYLILSPSELKSLFYCWNVYSLIGGADYSLIYRHYATLYFVFCVDSSESELGILDLIQVFVETLDKCFENVCELDLIFHVDKVCCSHSSCFSASMIIFSNSIIVLGALYSQRIGNGRNGA